MRWAALLVVVVACTKPHRTFPEPPPNLTPDERVAAFNRYVANKEHWITNNGNVVQHSVIMQDGTEVYYPEDLIPLVGEDSATARHTHEAIRLFSKSLPWQIAGTVVMLIGGGIAMSDVSADGFSRSEKLGIAVVLGGLALYGVGQYFAIHGNDETHAAYTTFDSDLAARLSVCAVGLSVLPCEELRPATTAPPPPTSGYYPSPLSSKPPPAP